MDNKHNTEAEDAANWRALINCARMTAMGSAGLTGAPTANNSAHLTINLWTVHEDHGDAFAREWLKKFVALARKAQGAFIKQPTTIELVYQMPPTTHCLAS